MQVSARTDASAADGALPLHERRKSVQYYCRTEREEEAQLRIRLEILHDAYCGLDFVCRKDFCRSLHCPFNDSLRICNTLERYCITVHHRAKEVNVQLVIKHKSVHQTLAFIQLSNLCFAGSFFLWSNVVLHQAFE